MKIETKAVRDHCTISLVRDDDKPVPLQDLLCDLERAVIDDTLRSKGGIKARVADHLCLNRTTLVMKARKYGFPLKKPQ